MGYELVALEMLVFSTSWVGVRPWCKRGFIYQWTRRSSVAHTARSLLVIKLSAIGIECGLWFTSLRLQGHMVSARGNRLVVVNDYSHGE